MDPAAILAVVLTGPGVPIVGMLVAGITQALKSVPGLGGPVTANPVVTTMILTAGILGYAVAATGYALDLVTGFGLFLVWLADNGFAKATYDTAKSVSANG